MNALKEIYNNLINEKVYGYDYDHGVRYPFFQYTIYPVHSRGEFYFGYTHYGSSAVKPTMRNLAWLIATIFEMTPEDFLQNYILKEESKIIYEKE